VPALTACSSTVRWTMGSLALGASPVTGASVPTDSPVTSRACDRNGIAWSIWRRTETGPAGSLETCSDAGMADGAGESPASPRITFGVAAASAAFTSICRWIEATVEPLVGCALGSASCALLFAAGASGPISALWVGAMARRTIGLVSCAILLAAARGELSTASFGWLVADGFAFGAGSTERRTAGCEGVLALGSTLAGGGAGGVSDRTGAELAGARDALVSTWSTGVRWMPAALGRGSLAGAVSGTAGGDALLASGAEVESTVR
jgi:hypothetical protein